MQENIYKPHLMRIEKIVQETPDVVTFQLSFTDKAVAESFSFKAGQFAEYSAFGFGESTFCIASSPTRLPIIECTFRKAGRNTTALMMLNEGDTIGFRGPYGNTFPINDWKGKDILFIAGGIALPPMRCVIWNVLDRIKEFGKVTIVYGARTEKDLVYKHELEEWDAREDVELWRCIDWLGFGPDGPIEKPAAEGWEPLNPKEPAKTAVDPLKPRKFTGFVPQVTELAGAQGMNPENTIAVVCGPPIMIKFTLPVLEKLNIADDAIFTTLENRMKCGVGKCGRCNVGSVYICKDGPVFNAKQLRALPPEY